jgi:hypothetical protein
MIMNEIRSIL